MFSACNKAFLNLASNTASESGSLLENGLCPAGSTEIMHIMRIFMPIPEIMTISLGNS